MKIAAARYDVTNPLKAIRMIYDGLLNAKLIQIDPDTTVKNLLLAKHTVELIESRKKKSSDDLIFTLVKDEGAISINRAVVKLGGVDPDDDDEDRDEDDAPPPPARTRRTSERVPRAR